MPMDLTHTAADARVYDWTPGDMTVYQLQLTVFHGGHASLAWINGRGPASNRQVGRAMLLPKHPPHWSYIAEKMDIREYDAQKMEQFLALAWNGREWSFSGIESAVYSAPETRR